MRSSRDSFHLLFHHHPSSLLPFPSFLLPLVACNPLVVGTYPHVVVVHTWVDLRTLVVGDSSVGSFVPHSVGSTCP